MKLFRFKKEQKIFKDVPDSSVDQDPVQLAKEGRLREIHESISKKRTGGVFVYGSRASTKDILNTANELRRTLQDQVRVNEMLKLHYVMHNIDEGDDPNIRVDHSVEHHMYELEQSLSAHKEISDFLLSMESKKNKPFSEMH